MIPAVLLQDDDTPDEQPSNDETIRAALLQDDTPTKESPNNAIP